MTDSSDQIPELVGEIVKLREDYQKMGLGSAVIDQELRKHLRPSRPLHRKSRPGSRCILFLEVLFPVVAAVCIGYAVYPEEMLEYSGLRHYACLVDNNYIVEEIARPLYDCDMCKDLERVAEVYKISKEEFEEKYAYTTVPVLIKGATESWSAMQTFSFQYLKQLYVETEGALDQVEEECQFFPYNTEFLTLAEAFNMSDRRAAYEEGEQPWYFGWSNCNEQIAAELRTQYQRPYFLPEDSESSRLDWIFMGGQGPGAHMHLDQVELPSWQAQVHGKKTWKLIPSPECEHVCREMDVTVEKGDIIVLDTNQWYHSTFIHPGELSITIGSEFD